MRGGAGCEASCCKPKMQRGWVQGACARPETHMRNCIHACHAREKESLRDHTFDSARKSVGMMKLTSMSV